MDDLVGTVEKIYEMMRTADIDGLMALAAPDVVLHQDPALPWGGAHVGRDGVVEFAMALVGTIDSVVTREVVFAAGSTVVQCGRTAGTVRSSGVPFDIPECHVWTFRDGLVAEVKFFIDSAAMLEALAH